MIIFGKNWRVLFSWNTRFEICPLALLPTLLSPNWAKRAESCIFCIEGDRKIEKVFNRTLKWQVCFWYQFLKILRFWLPWCVINPKVGQKGPKLVLHVPMVIERWKSIVKWNLKWSIRFWNHYFKILKFRFPLVMSSTQKWVRNVQIGISYTPMLIERWKSKVKGTLRWIIRLWNRSLKSFDSTWGCHQPKLARNLILHHFQKICKFGHFLIQF